MEPIRKSTKVVLILGVINILFLVIIAVSTIKLTKPLYNYYRYVAPHPCMAPIKEIGATISYENPEIIQNNAQLFFFVNQKKSDIPSSDFQNYYILKRAGECFRFGDDASFDWQSCDDACCLFSIYQTTCTNEILHYDGKTLTKDEELPAIALYYKTREIRVFDKLKYAQEKNVCGSHYERKHGFAHETQLSIDPQKCTPIYYSFPNVLKTRSE